MTLIKEKPNNKNRVTKTEDLSQETTKELGNSKDIDGKGKRSYKEAIWQEKTKPLKIEAKE